jgi:DNA-binding response OmpR family regulator
MKHILLAEDDPQIARLVKFKLEKEGFRVTWVEDGQRVLEQMAQETFDLILLDGMMPHLDGFQTLQALRQNQTPLAIPIVMLTARGQERDVQKGLDLGAADYIVKPFSPQELATRVKSLLEQA